ncbi:MAG TPA: hypothetical protein VF837_02500 [Patescibacteria group bacterium]
MNLPAINAPFAVTFRFSAQRSDPLRHLVSAFHRLSLLQPEVTSALYLQEGFEHAFIVEANSPISEEIRNQIRTWLQTASFLNFSSETETHPKEE